MSIGHGGAGSDRRYLSENGPVMRSVKLNNASFQPFLPCSIE